MQILYIGNVWQGSTALQRMEAMIQLGHVVSVVDTTPKWPRLLTRIARKLSRGVDLAAVNKELIKRKDFKTFDILWIDKGVTIKPRILQAIYNMPDRPIIAGYSPDEMTSPVIATRRFINSLPFYDIYFTTKSYITEELKALGCPEVKFVANAFDPNTHKPVQVTTDDRTRLGGQVGFIGNFEMERAASMENLADAGITVRIWGPNWQNASASQKRKLQIEYSCLWGDDYARAISAFDITLGYLCKQVRDQQTTRSVEVPACGGFLLAERTEEHLKLLKEGTEAEFFSNDEELINKCKKYLGDQDARHAISEAGRRRVVESGYSNPERLKWMLCEAMSLIETKQY